MSLIEEAPPPEIPDAAHHPPGTEIFLTEAITPEAWSRIADDQAAKEQLCEQVLRWHTEQVWRRGWYVKATSVKPTTDGGALFTSTCVKRMSYVLRAVADAPPEVS